MRQFNLFGALTGLVFALALALPAAAQRGQAPAPTPAPSPSPSPSPSPGTRTPTTPTPLPTPGQRGQQPDFGTQMPRSIFLSGKVMMEDGTPPPEPVTIERVCDGIPRPEAYTDSKGRFSFELGRNRAIIADASVGSDSMGGVGSRSTPGGMSAGAGGRGTMGGDQRILGCELRAALPGYRSDMVNLTGRKTLDNPDVGTIVLHRLGGVEGTTISATSLEAPKDAKKAFDKGMDSIKKQKWDEAQKHLEKAVEVYPRYAAAWYRLGFAYQQQNNADQARKAYAKSLEADGRYLEPYRQLAVLAFRDKDWQNLADTTDRVIRLDAVDFPDMYFFNSVANFQLRKLDAAEKSAREAVRLDTSHRLPKSEHVLGVILANKQDYAGAAQYMKSYLEHAPNAQDADAVRKQLVEVEKSAAAQKPN